MDFQSLADIINWHSLQGKWPYAFSKKKIIISREHFSIIWVNWLFINKQAIERQKSSGLSTGAWPRKKYHSIPIILETTEILSSLKITYGQNMIK